MDFSRVGGLSAEVREHLSHCQPESLGAMGRIPGVTPTAVLAVMAHLRQMTPVLA
jgi:tRNA uridine 5-carboxymethylaminomethyl modification enzyme